MAGILENDHVVDSFSAMQAIAAHQAYSTNPVAKQLWPVPILY